MAHLKEEEGGELVNPSSHHLEPQNSKPPQNPKCLGFMGLGFRKNPKPSNLKKSEAS